MKLTGNYEERQVNGQLVVILEARRGEETRHFSADRLPLCLYQDGHQHTLEPHHAHKTTYFLGCSCGNDLSHPQII